MREANAKTIIRTLDENVYSYHGSPKYLITNNGTEFVNNHMEMFSKEKGNIQTPVVPYHPQANRTERTNSILKTMIWALIGKYHRECDLHLHEFSFVTNDSVQESSEFSPFFLYFGRNP